MDVPATATSGTAICATRLLAKVVDDRAGEAETVAASPKDEGKDDGGSVSARNTQLQYVLMLVASCSLTSPLCASRPKPVNDGEVLMLQRRPTGDEALPLAHCAHHYGFRMRTHALEPMGEDSCTTCLRASARVSPARLLKSLSKPR